jgi:hypothetical protein
LAEHSADGNGERRLGRFVVEAQDDEPVPEIQDEAIQAEDEQRLAKQRRDLSFSSSVAAHMMPT